jgi:hypothetical protein
MALPFQVARVTLSGDMFGGSEIWTTGFYMGWENQDATAITPTGVADISNAWGTFFGAATTTVSSAFRYTMCKVAMIAQDGKTIADSAQYFSPAAPVVGGGTSNAFPPQVSLVATLANSLPRGLATKGRMYLPGINRQLQPDGKLDSTSCTQIATNLKTFFDTIHLDADLPGNPVLASVGRGPLHTDGAIRNISQIRIGSVYDTQRRRRNALTESYVTLPVAGG